MDQTQSMKWWFHSDLANVHLLFPGFTLETGEHVFAAYLFIFIICWLERSITFVMDTTLAPRQHRESRWKLVLLRTLCYGLATVLRLWYMLITMYFNISLFAAVVIALTTGQLATEILKTSARVTRVEYRSTGKGADEAGQSLLTE
ncbi:hypothetical protein DM01DRAFT_1331824 [Hesseltinella vesiculosa]|uniref:Copper transport protein n=1 Tax=Hesseltinella vesiculosa TaxID=101127 RepID=A0A1X2GWH2_9FUNG|nr:hypothetical protein DM01DRAFT_1331824 [Hesseltinella vesiculosa]